MKNKAKNKIEKLDQVDAVWEAMRWLRGEDAPHPEQLLEQFVSDQEAQEFMESIKALLLTISLRAAFLDDRVSALTTVFEN